jgi:hypothetical protein
VTESGVADGGQAASAAGAVRLGGRVPAERVRGAQRASRRPRAMSVLRIRYTLLEVGNLAGREAPEARS